MKKSSLNIVIIVAAMFAVACSPKPTIRPDFEKMRVATVAVLPVVDKTELPQNQVDDAFRDFSQELRNAGFLVLDDSLTRRVCPDTPCKNTAPLFNDYLVDATVQLTIESKTRANILAGYYNDMSGSLIMKDRNGEELLSAKATEREKGGLLFNSGQILQGLISQVRDSGSAGLIGKVSRALVAQIPATNRAVQTNLDSTTIAIKAVDVKVTSGDTREICVTATPRSIVSLVYSGLKTNLQESAPGRYCREFFLNPSFRMANAEVELRSPFGNSVRAPVDLQSINNCDLKSSLALLEQDKSSPSITFNCPTASGGVKLIVYRLDPQLPNYLRVGEIRGAQWSDSGAPGSSLQYAVVAKSSRGDRSLPVFLTSTAPEKK